MRVVGKERRGSGLQISGGERAVVVRWVRGEGRI